MYEKAVDNEMLSASGKGLTPRKNAAARGLKSVGSALGGDEINSECRTEDDDHHMDWLYSSAWDETIYVSKNRELLEFIFLLGSKIT